MTAIPVVEQGPIVVGVDTHKDFHRAAVLTIHGQLLADQRFDAGADGCRELITWAGRYGAAAMFAVEPTGTYGAALARVLLAAGFDVREVNRPHAHTKAQRGQSDAIDADAAARKALSGEAPAVPKTSTGVVESIRVLTVARNSAVKSRSVAHTQLQNLLITAPDELRVQVNAAGSGVKTRATACRRLRPDMTRLDEPMQDAKLVLRTIAQRIGDLDKEIAARSTISSGSSLGGPHQLCCRRRGSAPFTPLSS